MIDFLTVEGMKGASRSEAIYAVADCLEDLASVILSSEVSAFRRGMEVDLVAVRRYRAIKAASRLLFEFYSGARGEALRIKNETGRKQYSEMPPWILHLADRMTQEFIRPIEELEQRGTVNEIAKNDGTLSIAKDS